MQAAILFGSQARPSDAPTFADVWSDCDLHLLTNRSEAILGTDWARVWPGGTFCLKTLRPATGGARKLTVIFAEGGADLVLVSTVKMRMARFALRFGWHRRVKAMRVGLDETATCLSSGYRFLKGEKAWGRFYSDLVGCMSGVRLSDEDIVTQANTFLCDFLWVLQKLERGELLAAQHFLHSQLAEVNFCLLRELRLRRGQPLPSFGIARRVEKLLPPEELRWVTVDARMEPDALHRGAWGAYAGLQALMYELVPEWRVSPSMLALLERQRAKPAK